MRAVIDVNVFVAALLSAGGAPARVLRLWLDGAFELLVSPALVSELQRALAHPKIRAHVSAAEARRLVALLETGAQLVPDPSGEPPVAPADPDDGYLVAVAAAHGAALVTGDADLLALQARGVPVLSPTEFLRQLET
jgi:putative PIN family toxin of toxin-antitoxin system